MAGAFSYDELDEMEGIVNRATDGPWEVSCPEGEEWRQQAYDFAFISLARSSMPRLIAQLRLYMKSNEELQSLDGLQQLAIERLNK